MVNPVIPTVEIQRHLAGSYEALSHRLAETVYGERKRVFGEDDTGRIRILGTFKGHAIAVTENAKFAKVLYEVASNGELVVVGAEKLPIPVYEGEGGIRAFARAEAGSIIETFLNGDLSVSQDRITDLMRTVDSDPYAADKQIVASMIEGIFASDRKWCKVLGETAEVTEAVAAFEPKFLKLVDGSIPDVQEEAYRTLVVCDLRSLLDHLEGIYSEVNEAFASLTNLIDTNADLLKEESVVEMQAAVKDLLAHLLSSQATIAEALQNVSSVSALGELHDAIAIELIRHESAGKKISQSVADLASALTK